MRSPSPFVAGCCRSEPIAAAVAFWFLIAAHPAFALDPTRHFSDYVSTHFTVEDGLPAGVVDDIQQTPDGFLWLIVNSRSLVRFDGQNFDWIEAVRASSIAVAPNGDLWIGTRQDLRKVPYEDLCFSDFSAAVSYQPGPGPASVISCLAFAPDGVLWVGTAEGLFRFADDRFSPVGPRVGIRRIEIAASGRVLLITQEGYLEIDQSGVANKPALSAELGAKPAEIYHVNEDRHGSVWYCCAQGVARRSGNEWQKLGDYGAEKHSALQTFEDAQGSVWVSKAEGLCRVTQAGFELVVPKLSVRALCGDRDGNLWVGTNGDGLYRFKDPTFRMYTTADGLPNDVIMTVRVAQDGTIWAGANCGGLVRFDGTRFQTYDEDDGLLNSCVWTIAEDPEGGLWIGTWGGGAFRFHEGRFTQKFPGEIVSCIVAAKDGAIWFGKRNGLSRLRDGETRTFTTADGLSSDQIVRIIEDRTGRIMVATTKNFHLLVGDRFESHPSLPNMSAQPMGEDPTGGLLLCLDRHPFAIRIEGDRVVPITELGRMNSIIDAGEGDLWFAGFGVRRVLHNKFLTEFSQDEPLDSEPFSTLDGLAGTETSAGTPKMALDGQGRLWIATPHGLAMVDTRRVSKTSQAPKLYVREVTVGRETRPAPRELVLPRGTSHVEIDFAAVETTSPEKIRIQYKLDDVDTEWLGGLLEARAIFNSVPPGRHALRLRARNRSGVWDREGVAYWITQEPYFYQTGWFLAASIAAGLLVIVSMYRLRVRKVARQLSARFDERLAERTRVARELHDTFLQTVQGSKLVADHALKNRDDHSRLLGAVEQLALWLARATEEGRAALNSLRGASHEAGDLAASLRRAVDDCRTAGVDARFAVTGDVREVHPLVAAELHRIGQEAIRNACTHAAARVVEVTLEYGHDLTLRIADDGAGFDTNLLEQGKQSHFGLRGMRERAERIGGKLTITSAPGSGTTVTAVVPGRIAHGRLQKLVGPELQ